MSQFFIGVKCVCCHLEILKWSVDSISSWFGGSRGIVSQLAVLASVLFISMLKRVNVACYLRFVQQLTWQTYKQLQTQMFTIFAIRAVGESILNMSAMYRIASVWYSLYCRHNKSEQRNDPLPCPGCLFLFVVSFAIINSIDVWSYFIVKLCYAFSTTKAYMIVHKFDVVHIPSVVVWRIIQSWVGCVGVVWRWNWRMQSIMVWSWSCFSCYST